MSTLPPLRDVIARYGLGARKSLGQHFLLDANLTRRIARAAGDLSGCTVLEVGAGPGGLTRALLETDALRIVAVERDSRCIAALQELAAGDGRLAVVEADAIALDEASHVAPPAVVVANLPYNISTVLLLKWLETPLRYRRYVLMFQKEVAQRLAAGPGGKDYGRLSVLTQWLTTVERLFDVPGRAFTPPPKVESTVLRLTPRPQPLAPADPDLLKRLLAAAFGQRRKMLRRSLRGVTSAPLALLERCRIAPESRAEDLTIEDFCRLSEALRAEQSTVQ